MLVCPNCNKELKKGRHPHGVIWGCKHCGGRAASLSLLRKSIDKKTINQIWLRASNGVGVEGKRCPSCTKRMAQFTPNIPGVHWKLDCCEPCQMFWFDAGEFEDMPGIPPPPPAPDPNEGVPEKAREAMARIQLKHIKDDADNRQTSPEEGWKFIPAILMLPVEFDTNPLHHWPWLTWLIFASIILVFAQTVSNLGPIVDSYGFLPLDAFRLAGLTVITSFFLHGSLLHLLGNAYFLLIFGDNVEDYVGKWLFGCLILCSILLGTCVHALFDPNPDIPSIGASAGISGILAFYAMQFPRIRVGILVYFHWARIPVMKMLIVWFVLQYIGALYQIAGASKVSALAHLGGAVAGLAFWYFLNYFHQKQSDIYQEFS
ncbi:MAG: rhomboid family intramembrane serine protease [Candidatus Hinthialibacter antarcticus]|nr:rhomboid family intramembrane serine protease [Candidatus Hinthialibacter antarcticus]